MRDPWSISCWFFSPIHVVWFEGYQYIFVDLELEFFFLSSDFYHHSLRIYLCRFGFLYLLPLFFLSSLFHFGAKMIRRERKKIEKRRGRKKNTSIYYWENNTIILDFESNNPKQLLQHTLNKISFPSSHFLLLIFFFFSSSLSLESPS